MPLKSTIRTGLAVVGVLVLGWVAVGLFRRPGEDTGGQAPGRGSQAPQHTQPVAAEIRPNATTASPLGGTTTATTAQAVNQVIAFVAPAQAAARVSSPAVARFADASIPVEQRMSEIDQLGQRGDAAAVQILMTLGDTYTYLNFQAIEALGRVKTPEVARYLAGKTGDKDPKIVAAAMQSLAQVQGAAGIPVIAATLAANRQRPDGFQDTVCAAGVKALGEIGSPQAIPALAEEFEQTVGKTLQHEYGSQVIAAIKAIGDSAGVPALEAYALRLQTQRDAMSKNPMGQHYLDGKLAEVRAAIVFLLKTK